MIIDFHVHAFPDALAHRTIEALEKKGKTKAVLNGTLDSLRTSMKANGIDYSVILPIVTKPSQFDKINQYAAEINHTDGIVSFGGIHPDNENITEKLTYIKSLGLKGIKLHPDFQGPTYIDDERYINIIQECIRLGLCCVIHAGLDVGLPIPIHCPPDRAYIMLEKVLPMCTKDSKIVLAHIGGHLQWQLVEKLLVGKNVYFDLAYSLPFIEKDTLLRIIHSHGSQRILFATDSPWAGQKQTADMVRKLPLTQKQLDNIFYKNAMKLLDIKTNARL